MKWKSLHFYFVSLKSNAFLDQRHQNINLHLPENVQIATSELPGENWNKWSGSEGICLIRIGRSAPGLAWSWCLPTYLAFTSCSALLSINFKQIASRHKIQSGIQTNLVALLLSAVWCVILSRYSDVTMRPQWRVNTSQVATQHTMSRLTTNKSPQWMAWRIEAPGITNRDVCVNQYLAPQPDCARCHRCARDSVTCASLGEAVTRTLLQSLVTQHHGDQHQVHQVHTLPL